MTDKKSVDSLKRPKTPRERAEKMLRVSVTDIEQVSSEDARRLLHELQIHQIELELQNEELRESQLELAQTRDRLADLYEFAPVGYLTLDPRGTILQANLTAEKILDTSRDRILGSPLAKFVERSEADRLHLHLLRVAESATREVCQLRMVRADGRRCHVRLESIRSLQAQETPQCWTTLSDITELVELQQAAERSQRLAALGTLAAGIAHEINNPLWMISLQAESALTAKNKQIVTECLLQIKKLVERGGRIVNNVLCFSKAEATDEFRQPLLEIISRANDYTRVRAESKQVDVLLDIPAGLSRVMIKATEMELVFVNLLANAIDASHAGGYVRVSASWNAEMVKVRIEDEGCGMSPEQCDRIFDPFYTTHRDDGGTGLGMNIVHRIVHDHHGRVEVASESGKGTTMTVCIPFTEDLTLSGASDGNDSGS